MTYYEHEGKKYLSLDALCASGIIANVRRVQLLTGQELWFLDVDDISGFQVDESDALRVAAQFDIPIEMV